MAPDGLIVADYRAAKVYRLRGSDVTCIDEVVVAEHAGILGLPSDAGWVCLDDRAGTLTVHAGGRVRRLPMAIPGEHLACDQSGRYVVATTGLGAAAEPWSDVVNVVDLEADVAVRFRSRTGEPGAMMVDDQITGAPTVLLRHREPGAIEAIPVGDCLAVGPHVPLLTGRVTGEIAGDGHGDAVDPESGIAVVATSRGLERFVVENGRPRAIGLIAWPVRGRAYYLRYDAVTRRVLAVVRGGPQDPAAWTQWQNHLIDADPVDGHVRTWPLPDGLAFRFGAGGGRVAVASIHPVGDAVTVVDRTPGTSRVRTVDLLSMTNPPASGRLPWDRVGDAPAQRRAVAVDPTGSMIAVTRGGDGELHLIGDDATTTVPVPTALDEGGCLYWPGGSFDSVGR